MGNRILAAERALPMGPITHGNPEKQAGDDTHTWSMPIRLLRQAGRCRAWESTLPPEYVRWAEARFRHAIDCTANESKSRQPPDLPECGWEVRMSSLGAAASMLSGRHDHHLQHFQACAMRALPATREGILLHLVDDGVVGGVLLRTDGEDGAERVHCHPEQTMAHLTASARVALAVKQAGPPVKMPRSPITNYEDSLTILEVILCR